jgi:GWxTD domain-containing protein
MRITRFTIWCSTLSLLVFVLVAQDDKKQSKNSRHVSSPVETSARPLTDRERKARDKTLRKELATPYAAWLRDDVGYIITPEEEGAFRRLQTDDEREQFIEQFWLRRDPSPDTVENEYKEEHYRRIAYANEHFASGIPGWKTDRGRVYIIQGTPDSVEDHSSGGSYQRPFEEGGGTTSTHPFQIWRYRHIEGLGENIMLEFVDPSGSGEFHLTIDPSEKDALLHVPNAGLTQAEALGYSTKADRISNPLAASSAFGGTPESMNEFSRLNVLAGIFRPPPAKYRDLEAEIRSTVRFNLLPVKMRIDFIPITAATVMTYVTVQFENKDLTLKTAGAGAAAEVTFAGYFTGITGRPAANFDDTLRIDAGAKTFLPEWTRKKSMGQRAVALAPGRYRLKVFCKDSFGGSFAEVEQAVDVPRLEADKPFVSMILADQIEKLPPRSIGAGPFVIGDSKVRPRIGEIFRRDELLAIYTRLYNFPAGSKIQYEIIPSGSSAPVLVQAEEAGFVPGAPLTIEKQVRLSPLAPGRYTVRVTISSSTQSHTESAGFTVL